MIYHQRQSDDDLCYLIWPEKQKKINHTNTKFLTIFNGRNKNHNMKKCVTKQLGSYALHFLNVELIFIRSNLLGNQKKGWKGKIYMLSYSCKRLIIIVLMLNRYLFKHLHSFFLKFFPNCFIISCVKLVV